MIFYILIGCLIASIATLFCCLDAGLGVFAKERFDSDVIFGPYWGKKTYVDDVLANMDQSYMWDVRARQKYLS